MNALNVIDPASAVTVPWQPIVYNVVQLTNTTLRLRNASLLYVQ